MENIRNNGNKIKGRDNSCLKCRIKNGFSFPLKNKSQYFIILFKKSKFRSQFSVR